MKHELTKTTRNTFGRTDQERKASEFLQEKEASLCNTGAAKTRFTHENQLDLSFMSTIMWR
jgi:hypothetical protein